MAREKTWQCHQNLDVDGADDARTAGNWMLRLYNFLSGGASPDMSGGMGSIGKWTVCSASNSTVLGANPQGAYSSGGNSILSKSDGFVWSNTGAHSWFVMKKDILPVTASTTRYVYLTVACNTADDNQAYFSFDHQLPNFSGQSTSARPLSGTQAYGQFSQYRTDYDASNPTYFHGTIDTTGSFHVVGAQQRATNGPSYQFALSCARVETPHAAEVETCPVFLKCGWVGDSTTMHGPWGGGDDQNWGYANNCTGYSSYQYSAQCWDQPGGQAMWDSTGSAGPGGGGPAVDGFYAGFLQYVGGWQVSNQSPICDNWRTGDQLSNSYILLPSFLATNRYANASTTPTDVRGRLPDVFGCMGSVRLDCSLGEGYGLGGLTIPKTGDIEYCVAGDYFLPFSASLLPGS
jgi:hypothetical protein